MKQPATSAQVATPNSDGVYSLWVRSKDSGASIMSMGDAGYIFLIKRCGKYSADHYGNDHLLIECYAIQGPQVEWAAQQEAEGIAANLYNNLLTGGQA